LGSEFDCPVSSEECRRRYGELTRPSFSPPDRASGSRAARAKLEHDQGRARDAPEPSAETLREVSDWWMRRLSHGSQQSKEIVGGQAHTRSTPTFHSRQGTGEVSGNVQGEESSGGGVGYEVCRHAGDLLFGSSGDMEDVDGARQLSSLVAREELAEQAAPIDNEPIVEIRAPPLAPIKAKPKLEEAGLFELD